MQKLLPVFLFLLLAGAMNGFMDALQFHGAWQEFENVEFWNPSVSWENKWAKDAEGNIISGKEKFWGSSRWFVAFTDGWHLIKFMWLNFVTLVVIFSLRLTSTFELVKSKLKRWKLFAIPAFFIGIRIVMSIGFHITYSLIF